MICAQISVTSLRCIRWKPLEHDTPLIQYEEVVISSACAINVYLKYEINKIWVVSWNTRHICKEKTQKSNSTNEQKTQIFSLEISCIRKIKIKSNFTKKTNIQDKNHFDLQCFDEKKTQAEIFFAVYLKNVIQTA